MLIGQAGTLIPFTPLEFALIGVYLIVLIVIGAWGYFARRENSLQDFYLAGSGIGFIVLILTLYATQYSGNTLIGFTGQTYVQGYRWTVSVHFMTAIVVFYLAFAPRLYPLARREGFITPADFIAYRYQSPALAVLTSIVMIVGVANFLVGQLMAMGRALQGLTDADPLVAYSIGVIVLAVIVVVYESFGGFRAVVWTDAVQGLILMFGFGVLLWMVWQSYGSIQDATERLLVQDRERLAAAVPGEEAKTLAHPPGTRASLQWLSYIVAVGIGGALYPQAIQRIYAARRPRSLRRSLAVMAFLPLATTLVSLAVGIIATSQIDSIPPDQKDTVLAEVCRQIQEGSVAGRVLVAILFAAILAALMSTADSILLSISSMFTRDLYQRVFPSHREQAQLTRVGKVVSWLSMLVAVLVAIGLHIAGQADLVSLLDRKFDLLVQLAPAFMIGIHWKPMRSGPILLGMCVGLAIALTLTLTGETDKPFGIHAGLYGLIANTLIAFVGSLRPTKRMTSGDAVGGCKV